MASIKAPACPKSLACCCYRLTPRGQARLVVDGTEARTTGSLSPYLLDVLEICGSGVWFEQLQQFKLPCSLDESPRSLLALALGLVELWLRTRRLVTCGLGGVARHPGVAI